MNILNKKKLLKINSNNTICLSSHLIITLLLTIWESVCPLISSYIWHVIPSLLEITSFLIWMTCVMCCLFMCCHVDWFQWYTHFDNCCTIHYHECDHLTCTHPYIQVARKYYLSIHSHWTLPKRSRPKVHGEQFMSHIISLTRFPLMLNGSITQVQQTHFLDMGVSEKNDTLMHWGYVGNCVFSKWCFFTPTLLPMVIGIWSDMCGVTDIWLRCVLKWVSQIIDSVNDSMH